MSAINEGTVGKTNQGALWGGRFADGPSPELAVLSKSTQFDWILTPYDIAGSKAHAKALLKAGVITEFDFNEIETGLDSMLEDYQRGKLQPNNTDEDVHGALERILIERIGDEAGGKLRAGRSRNDQIATEIRMYLLDAEVRIRHLVIQLLEVIANRASEALTALDGKPAVMPGRTHLQHAQPVLVSHQVLAHGWSILRDLERMQDWRKRASQSPYGAGALAGSTLGLDAVLVAKELGLSGVMPNSIDAVSARDTTAEFSFCLTQLALNLSRMAEEVILWNTKEFGFIKLDDAYSTGSSIMPQKKNPDIAELTRGKTGRIIGDLTGLLATLKALPLAYNRDLQEDKEPVFDQVQQLEMILPAFTGQLATANLNYTRMADLAPRGFALATDIAEWLVKRGVPFREAHELSGACVSFVEQHLDLVSNENKSEMGNFAPMSSDIKSSTTPSQPTPSPITNSFSKVETPDLWDIPDADFERLLSISDEDVQDLRAILSAEGSVNMRDNFSGTAPSRVQQQLINFTKRVNDLR